MLKRLINMPKFLTGGRLKNKGRIYYNFTSISGFVFFFDLEVEDLFDDDGFLKVELRFYVIRLQVIQNTSSNDPGVNFLSGSCSEDPTDLFPFVILLSGEGWFKSESSFSSSGFFEISIILSL